MKKALLVIPSACIGLAAWAFFVSARDRGPVLYYGHRVVGDTAVFGDKRDYVFRHGSGNLEQYVYTYHGKKHFDAYARFPVGTFGSAHAPDGKGLMHTEIVSLDGPPLGPDEGGPALPPSFPTSALPRLRAEEAAARRGPRHRPGPGPD